MIDRRQFLASAILLPAVLRSQTATAGIMQPVSTRAFNNYRTGCNTGETVLTQANVAARGIRQYYSLFLEGDARGAESQPLLCPNVTMGSDGSVRDVLVVSTMNNLVWGFDANTSDILWCSKLGIPVKGNASIDAWNINDHWGVLSTGVLDLDTFTWYGVAWESFDGTPQHGEHWFYGIDIRTGQIVGKPINLSLAVYQPPNGLPAQRFNSGMRKQRCSLLLTNRNGIKTVFLASGSVLETSKGAAGWVMAIDIASFALSATLALAIRGYGAGVWMGGSGIVEDIHGDLLLVTGNGSFDGVTDWAESGLKIRYTPASNAAIIMRNPNGSTSRLKMRTTPIAASLTVVDNFTPYTDAERIGEPATQSSPKNKYPDKLAGISLPSETDEGSPVNGMHMHPGSRATVNLAAFRDEDLGSGPAIYLPKQDVVAECGKDSVIYIQKDANLGHTQLADFATPTTITSPLLTAPFWFGTYDAADSPNPPNLASLDIFPANKTHHMHSGSLVWESSLHGTMVFSGAENSNVRAWSVDATGKVWKYLACSSETPSIQATGAAHPHGGMTGSFMCLSSNGSKPGTGLLWVLMPYGDANQQITNGRLLCYDPENFGTFSDGSKQLRVLWDSEKFGIPFMFDKFCPPIVSGGTVFVTTYDAKILALRLA